MAIEIVHRGKHPKDTDYEGTCYTCKTKIKCKQSDGRIKPAYDQRDRESLMVTCPVCSATINCYEIRPNTSNWYDR
jgi:hypothetical protein